jgi:phage terminase large subunit-like protein
MPSTKRKKRTAAGTRGESISWVRNAADEKAVAAGMRFDEERGRFTCDWIEQYCHLYEGEFAGQPMILLPCWRDFFMRAYGWVRWSDEWNQWIRRFTHIAFWGAKKNAKSPNCAAHNLFMLVGDGEQGQKVYQGAANGQQAEIAQKHAINMVLQSPELDFDCKINNSTLEILHKPSNSVLQILTGDDSRGAKAKEGLNGSISYDEMHVVNREMEERTSRAGISRKQPINASFSTAGDDPSSVGRQRYEHGQAVNRGGTNDLHFLHVDYSAPEKVSEADIEVRLEELGRMANPAWGTIVKPSEFRADWERSKGRPSEVARFKQYRLNMWVGSTNQWLDGLAWESAGEDYTLEDLEGRECYLAIDLSRTRDMTAAVFAFPWPEFGPEVVRLWPMFWLPELTARDRNHLFPFRSWREIGALALTPGGMVDYSQVKQDIRNVIERHRLDVADLYYDPKYANELTQALHEGETMGAASVLGVVRSRTLFKQDMANYSPLCKEFERRVSGGLIRHPKNAVLTWQVGHCEVYRDRDDNIRPVKPQPHSGKCVDGVQASVMTLAGVISSPTVSYISRPVIV